MKVRDIGEKFDDDYLGVQIENADRETVLDGLIGELKACEFAGKEVSSFGIEEEVMIIRVD